LEVALAVDYGQMHSQLVRNCDEESRMGLEDDNVVVVVGHTDLELHQDEVDSRAEQGIRRDCIQHTHRLCRADEVKVS
jgi:hypothetical protein